MRKVLPFCRGGGWVERGGDACVARRPSLQAHLSSCESKRATQASPPIHIIHPRPYRISGPFPKPPSERRGKRCPGLFSTTNQWNCANSVEPVRAVVEDSPPEMTWATSSK